MLGHRPFSYSLLSKYRTVFATLFNDIFVSRKDVNGAEIERILVPVTYSAKRAWYARINQDPNLEKQASITLPMIGFNLINISLDQQRFINPIHKLYNQRDPTTYNKILAPVPYDLNFEVYVGVKTHDDGFQIMEQILSFFVPDFTLTMKDPTGVLDVKLSVPIIIGTPTIDETFKTDFSQRQSINWVIPFTLKAWLFGASRTQGLIREVLVDMHIAPSSTPITQEEMDESPRSVRITVTPDPSDALPEDSWTYNTTVEDFYDGKKYNPATGLDE